MAQPKVIDGIVREGENFVFVARLVADDGSVLVDSSVSDWSLNVFNRSSSTPDVAIYTLPSPQTVTDVMQPSLTLDGYWDLDNIGYTFRAITDTQSVPALLVPGGEKLLWEYRMVTFNYGIKYVVFETRIARVETTPA